jgi:hypothetical protein
MNAVVCESYGPPDGLKNKEIEKPEVPDDGVLMLSHVIRMKLAALGSKRQVLFFGAQFNREDMLALKDLLETGKVKPFVERTYPLSKIADAMRRLGDGHARGKIVVTKNSRNHTSQSGTISGEIK